MPVTVFGDDVDEPPAWLGEWALVRFSNPSPNAELDLSFFGLGIAVIIDDDPSPTITPGGVGIWEGNEGQVTVEVPVMLSNPSAEPVAVDWQTYDPGGTGIATAYVDYLSDAGTVTLIAASSRPADWWAAMSATASLRSSSPRPADRSPLRHGPASPRCAALGRPWVTSRTRARSTPTTSRYVSACTGAVRGHCPRRRNGHDASTSSKMML